MLCILSKAFFRYLLQLSLISRLFLIIFLCFLRRQLKHGISTAEFQRGFQSGFQIPYLMYNPKVVYKSKTKDGSTRPYRLSVEGNIGSGKSTFLKYFQQFNAVETYLVKLYKFHQTNLWLIIRNFNRSHWMSGETFRVTTCSSCSTLTCRNGTWPSSTWCNWAGSTSKRLIPLRLCRCLKEVCKITGLNLSKYAQDWVAKNVITDIVLVRWLIMKDCSRKLNTTFSTSGIRGSAATQTLD